MNHGRFWLLVSAIENDLTVKLELFGAHDWTPVSALEFAGNDTLKAACLLWAS